MDNNYVSAIILAAGSGSRMKNEKTKQQISILGKSILKRTVEAFQLCNLVSEIVVVSRADEVDFAKTETQMYSKVSAIVSGGRTRAESAANGFMAINAESKYVAVHDAARCLVSIDDISKVILDAYKYGAATASYKATDSIKKIGDDGFITETCDRSNTVHVLTPQIFSREIYKRAIDSSDLLDPAITDDNRLVENIGVFSYCTPTRRDNIKITYDQDVAYAELILKGKAND